jgi:allantoate deiminase
LRLGERVMGRLDELALISEEKGKITRLFLTPTHREAMGRVRSWMEEAGLDVEFDDIGNVVGRLEGSSPEAPTFILGSHIDSVRDAGRYDGCFGVVSAIEVVEELRRSGAKLPFGVEVVAFGDEEGVRFPTTLSGSRALAGNFMGDSLDMRDADGISLRQALQQFGCDPEAIGAIARERGKVCGYLESHIEQGPVLEQKGLALGVVTAISGASRFGVKVRGEAGHAGTVPMAGRKDALAGAAAMISAVEEAPCHRDMLVATVGTIAVSPGAINVIPGEASFSVDLRAPVDAARREATDAVQERMRAIAAERGLSLELTPLFDAAATACDPALIEALAATLTRKGHRDFRLPSGAGHDAMTIAPLCPVVMLFLRCKGGISHNPAESIALEDAQAAIEVMLDFLVHYRPPSSEARSRA